MGGTEQGAGPYTIQPSMKRPPADEAHPFEPPAKKQSKWSAEENELIIRLRGDGMKWDDVSRHLPGRSAISCRLHYQNFLERRPDWDEEKKNKLARLYERFRREMWERVARELRMPWRAAEDMHWQLGKTQLAERAGVQPFQAAPDAAILAPPPAPGVPITTSFVPLPSQAYQPPMYTTASQIPQGAKYTQSPAGHPGFTYPHPPQGYPAQQGNASEQPNYGSSGPPPPPPPQAHPTTQPQQQQYAAPHSPHHTYPQSIAPGPVPAAPVQRLRRSASNTSQPSSQQAYSRASPSTSPRRRALSASRLAASGIPPGERRTPPSPAPSLPSLPREYYTSNAQGVKEEGGGAGQKLAPVRFLTEETFENARQGGITESGREKQCQPSSRPPSESSLSTSTLPPTTGPGPVEQAQDDQEKKSVQ